jgi:hypothetical protein
MSNDQDTFIDVVEKVRGKALADELRQMAAPDERCLSSIEVLRRQLEEKA